MWLQETSIDIHSSPSWPRGLSSDVSKSTALNDAYQAVMKTTCFVMHGFCGSGILLDLAFENPPLRLCLGREPSLARQKGKSIPVDHKIGYLIKISDIDMYLSHDSPPFLTLHPPVVVSMLVRIPEDTASCSLPSSRAQMIHSTLVVTRPRLRDLNRT